MAQREASMRSAAYLVIIALLSAPRAGAQRTPGVAPGDRVRVWLQTCFGCTTRPWATGTLVALGPDSLIVWEGDGATRSTPLAQVRWLQVSGGRGGSALGRGAALGATGGALAGAVVGAIAYEAPNCPPYSWCSIGDFGPGVAALGGALLGAFSGALIGAVVGSSVPGPERWVTVPATRLRPHVSRRQERLLLGASFRL